MAIQSSPSRITYEEFAAMPDDGKRYELVDGELLVSPGPAGRHQAIGFNILRAFMDAFDQPAEGLAFYELEVKFTRFKVVRPDVLFLSARNKDRYRSNHIDGPPDLVVEILSPGNERHDLVRKYTWYEEYGVPEYWIVYHDLPRVEVYRQLPGEGFGPPVVLDASGMLMSGALPSLELPVAEIYSGLPED